jgi:integrase/recombinase XerD
MNSNPKNDRLKREYLLYLKDARQRSAATAEQARRAIDRLEAYTGFKDFGSFNKEQARAFKKKLIASKTQRSGEPIRIATAHHILQAIKEFLLWLHSQPGHRRRINPAEVAYLNLTSNEERQAKATTPRRYASLEQYRAALFALPDVSEVERRDKALMALLLLTAMRDAAIIGLKLRHISIERGYVFQDPREIDTKFRKAINTFFYPVGEDVPPLVRDWVSYLTVEKLFGPDDPLFPKTLVAQSHEQSFEVRGLTREHWANAAPVRDIFKRAFGAVGLPYFQPHSVRHTITQLAYKLELSPERLKAWSQNMGHENVLTTLSSYGTVSLERQEELLAGLSNPKGEKAGDGDIAAVRRLLSKLEKEQA